MRSRAAPKNGESSDGLDSRRKGVERAGRDLGDTGEDLDWQQDIRCRAVANLAVLVVTPGPDIAGAVERQRVLATGAHIC